MNILPPLPCPTLSVDRPLLSTCLTALLERNAKSSAREREKRRRKEAAALLWGVIGEERPGRGIYSRFDGQCHVDARE